jgi:type 1 glutamine amidotransferase
MKTHRLPRNLWSFLLLLGLSLLHGRSSAAGNDAGEEWQALFDGATLNGWKVTPFGGHGEVSVEGTEIHIAAGAILSGITWTNPVIRMNYEIEVEVRKTEGSDFFCALTIPVRDTNCTFVVGGWGGGLVGISSIDGMDASENETSKVLNFEMGRWYKLKARVTESKIECWIDQEKIIDVKILGRKISMRPGEIEENVPLGIATFQTSSSIRSIRLRKFIPPPKKIVLIAGTKSHGPGEHEYEKDLALLQQALQTSPNAPKARIELHRNGWPADNATLEDADTIVLFNDGSDRDEKAHPLLTGDRLRVLSRQMKRGCGLVALHYSLFLPATQGGNRFIDWVGAYFDYESGTTSNKWFSKIETREFSFEPVKPDHPILQGVKPFSLKDEFYFNLKFAPNDDRLTPILAFAPDTKALSSVVAWAVERDEGGRGFGFSGGHARAHWKNESLRRLVLNAILWTARLDVPPGGVQSATPAE